MHHYRMPNAIDVAIVASSENESTTSRNNNLV